MLKKGCGLREGNTGSDRLGRGWGSAEGEMVWELAKRQAEGNGTTEGMGMGSGLYWRNCLLQGSEIGFPSAPWLVLTLPRLPSISQPKTSLLVRPKTPLQGPSKLHPVDATFPMQLPNLQNLSPLKTACVQ